MRDCQSGPPARTTVSILREEHLDDFHHEAGIPGKSEAGQDALITNRERQYLQLRLTLNPRGSPW